MMPALGPSGLAKAQPGSVAAQAPDLQASRGRYRVVAELGSGGMARIYLALLEQSGFRKLSVLKTPRRDAIEGEGFDLIEMIRREAQVAARLKHRHIVETYEVVDDRGWPVIAMEFLEGATLRELINRTRKLRLELAVRHQLEIIIAICHALHYCHEVRDLDGTPMQLVHRDVSPHNVFITFDGDIKLLDFGIAKAHGVLEETRGTVLKGKLRYMAPEYVRRGKADRRSDVYALGVLLWEAATDRVLWGHCDERELIATKLQGGAVTTGEARPGCPPGVLEIARRCLADDPNERFASAREVAERLQACVSEMDPADPPLTALVDQCFAERRDRLRAVVSEHLHPKAVLDGVSGPIHWPVEGQPEYFVETAPLSTTSNVVQRPDTDPASGTSSKRNRHRALAWSLAGAVGVSAAFLLGWAALPPSEAHALPDATLHRIEVPSFTHAVRRHADLDLAARLGSSSLPPAPPLRLEPEEPPPRPAAPPKASRRGGGSGGRTAKAAPARSPRPEPAKPAPAAHCSPPFFVDALGIKRFKPECL